MPWQRTPVPLDGTLPPMLARTERPAWGLRVLFVVLLGVIIGLDYVGLTVPNTHIFPLPLWAIGVMIVINGLSMAHSTKISVSGQFPHLQRTRLHLEIIISTLVVLQYGLLTGLCVALGGVLVSSLLRSWLSQAIRLPHHRVATWLMDRFDEDASALHAYRPLRVAPSYVVLDGLSVLTALGIWDVLRHTGWPGLRVLSALGHDSVITAVGIMALVTLRFVLTLCVLEILDMAVVILITRQSLSAWKTLNKDWLQTLLPLVVGLEMVIIVPFAMILHSYSFIGYAVFMLLYWKIQKSLTLQRKLVEQTVELQVQQQSALTDFLSGLPNRRALEEYSQRLQTAGIPTVVAMVDGDNFKRVNDTWGHDVGDFVIQTLSARISTKFRVQAPQWPDMVARWGGEEFVILLPLCPWPVAQQKLEDTRAFVAHTPMVRDVETSVPMTISVGASLWTPHLHVSIPDVLEQESDTAVYKAKKQGRDQVVYAPEATARWQRWVQSWPDTPQFTAF